MAGADGADEDVVLRWIAGVGAAVLLCAHWLPLGPGFGTAPSPPEASAGWMSARYFPLAGGIAGLLAASLPARVGATVRVLLLAAIAVAGVHALGAMGASAGAWRTVVTPLMAALTVAGGALAARLAEPGLRLPRNALAIAVLAATVSALLPVPAVSASVPLELTGLAEAHGTPLGVWVAGAIGGAGRLPSLWALFALAFLVFAALATWVGPDAGVRRSMPRSMWLGVLLVPLSSAALLISAALSSEPELAAYAMPRARVALTSFVVWAWLELVVAAALVRLSGTSDATPDRIWVTPPSDETN
jgi:hypothetical protein